VAYAREGHDAALQALAGKGSPRILRATARPDMTACELEEYSSAAGTASTCRSTGGWPPGSAARC
jgi:methylated-DNA-[protein]-cysteine S-methyltransferase